MKKFIVLFLMALLLSGCSTLQQSEYLEHDKMYKNWDHMKFSWFGHRNYSEEDIQKSIDQGWWGFEMPYVPGE
jgi:uncharacterized protein YceK